MSFGGKVEHDVFLFSNLIPLVIEMKFSFKNARDYYAQVLLELVCKTFRLLHHAIHLISTMKLQ